MAQASKGATNQAKATGRHCNKKGKDHIASLKVPRLKDILIYLYDMPKKDANKMKKHELHDAIFLKIAPLEGTQPI